MASGLMIAPKVFTIIHGMELGKSDALPNIMGRSFVRSDDSAEVEDMIKSERQSVIDWIEVKKIPQPEKVLTYQRYFIV